MLKFFKLSWLLILIMPGLSYSFDGDRRGFTASFGLGIAPYAYWEQNTPPVDNTSVGYGFGLTIGHGWDDQNTILFSIDGYGYNSEIFDIDYTFVQGLYSARWNHYFSPTLKSIFITVGAGIRFFGISQEKKSGELEQGNRGYGYQVGFGYQFYKYFQVGLYYSGGKTGCNDVDFQHHIVHVLLELIAF